VYNTGHFRRAELIKYRIYILEEYGIFKGTPKWITQGILEVAECIIQDIVENKNAKHRVFYIEEANFKTHGILEESESLKHSFSKRRL
jgi:hypothetical protein